MFDRWLHRDPPIGCEIASGHVRLAQVLGARGRRQTTVAWAGIDPGAGEAKPSPDALTRAVRQALDSARFKGRRVVSCLPPAQLKYRPLRVAPMPDAELASAAHWKVATELGVKAERMKSAVVHLGRATEGGKSKIELVSVAAELDVLESHATLLANAGLEPVAIDLSCCGIARCAAETSTGPDGGATPVLELHAAGATLSAVSGGRVCFLRSLASGLGRAHETIASLLDVAPAQARKVQAALGDAAAGADWLFAELGAERVRDAVADGWQLYGRELARDVALSLRYFCDTFGQSLETTGWLLAESPVGEAAVDVLQDQTGVSFAPPDALVHDRFRPALITPAAGSPSACVTALGLSLYEQTAAPARADGEAA